ncbi:MAG: acyltransferase family protein [Oscillospiraceae bacterium]|nr:acyltransferase family protein [Oscillospiraceae bacterium]
MKGKRIVYLDYLRIVSIFAVVMLHVAAWNWYDTDVHSYEWQVLNGIDGVLRWGAPVFVMISGAVNLGKDIPLKTLLFKRILRLVVAYVFWGVLYIVWRSLMFWGSFPAFKEFVKLALAGHYHTWFMGMMIGLYLSIPMLNRIVADRKTAWYFVAVCFVFEILLSEGLSLLGLRHPQLAGILMSFVSLLQPKMFLGYSIYFVLGYLLHTAELKNAQRNWLYMLGLLGVLFTVIATALYSCSENTQQTRFYEYFTLNVLLASAGVFVLAKTKWNRAPSSSKGERLLSFAAKCSFGVYLVHPMFIESFKKLLDFYPLSFNPILAVPAESVAVFALSFLISALLNKLPILNKWIV